MSFLQQYDIPEIDLIGFVTNIIQVQSLYIFL
jgi:hypothetical protein